MADKKKSGISIMPVFVDGEQPSAAKFNSIGAQVKRSDYILETSIGDIWGESYPYSTFSDAKLSLDTIAFNGTRFLSYSKGLDLNIASLGRIIGPANLLDADVCSYNENGVADNELVETVPKGVNQFTLKYVPSNTPVFALTNIFSNQVTNANDLSSAGDYFVDSKGNVITVTTTPTGSAGTVTYKTKPVNSRGGADAIGSTFNLIPSSSQLELSMNNSAAHLSLVEETDGVYLVSLPNRLRGISNIDLTSTTIGPNHPDRDQKYILPLSITLICGGNETTLGTDSPVSNVEIPQGMLYLKNESTGEVYTEATYYYVSNTSFRIQLNATLDIGVDKFSVITVGSNITSNIRSLKMKQNAHSHSREFGEPLISIEDIDGIFKSPGESGIFIPSGIENNYMPQYLHRDGSRDTDIGLNDNNAMRGDLIIGRKEDENENLITEAGNYLGEGESFSLKFGDISSSTNALIYKSYSSSSGSGSFNVWANSNQLFLFSQKRIFAWTSGEEGIELSATGGNIKANTPEQIEIYSPDTRVRSHNGGTYGKFQAFDGIALGNHGLNYNLFDNNFKSASANGLWFIPQMKTITFRHPSLRFKAKDIDGNWEYGTGTDADYIQGDIDLPVWLTHGTNPTFTNGVNLEGDMLILPIQIQCLVRRKGIGSGNLTNSSWWSSNSTYYAQGARDFVLDNVSARDAGEPPAAHIVGMLMAGGDTYNNGKVKYRILIDTDEGYDGVGGANDFSRYHLTAGDSQTSTPSYMDIEVVFTLWYLDYER